MKRSVLNAVIRREYDRAVGVHPKATMPSLSVLIPEYAPCDVSVVDGMI